ncbi:hypothetical protein WR25_00952 [Diploscapter pachys]|uniref:Uncharacterized protein n=1 Tax=Diploscapter pachys TaxID=2018661 RepID=A0A2A2LA38_9BILA|nr:hypothetical protein WR25_00952 [Diploscapter pachys]
MEFNYCENYYFDEERLESEYQAYVNRVVQLLAELELEEEPRKLRSRSSSRTVDSSSSSQTIAGSLDIVSELIRTDSWHSYPSETCVIQSVVAEEPAISEYVTSEPKSTTASEANSATSLTADASVLNTDSPTTVYDRPFVMAASETTRRKALELVRSMVIPSDTKSVTYRSSSTDSLSKEEPLSPYYVHSDSNDSSSLRTETPLPHYRTYFEPV